MNHAGIVETEETGDRAGESHGTGADSRDRGVGRRAANRGVDLKPGRPHVRFLRLCDVMKRYPWSRTTIWRKSRAGLFPRPVVFDGIPMWAEHELDAFGEEKLAARG